MKRIVNCKGFAMVETLIAAVSVIGIFTLLFNLIYPMVGGYQTSLNYDDLDTKYIAFYIREMLETDATPNTQKSYLMDFEEGEGTYRKYSRKVFEMEGATETNEDHLTYTNEICDGLDDGTRNERKNNQYFCRKYVEAANVTNIFITNYNTVDFKDQIKSSNSSFTRSFKNYVAYMPTFKDAKEEKKQNYRRIIVEVEHTSSNTSEGKYYTYATMEVRTK